MAMLCVAEGASVIRETVFENRFMQVAELARMGADIDLTAMRRLCGASKLERRAGDGVGFAGKRGAGACGLVAEKGETAVARVYHIDRGYERIEERLSALGADIQRVRH